jgi:hypothetical protein
MQSPAAATDEIEHASKRARLADTDAEARAPSDPSGNGSDDEDAVALQSLPTAVERAAAARAAAAAVAVSGHATTNVASADGVTATPTAAGPASGRASQAALAAATAAYQSALSRTEVSAHCPYLSTVDRSQIDFDFPRVCSVSLSPINVYACLVCGVFLAGRGKQSPAYRHALDAEHHVFMALSTSRFYCLPDGYEVTDPSLEDIKLALEPRFTPRLIRALDGRAAPPAAAGAGSGPVVEEGVVVAGEGVRGSAVAYDGTKYIPGILGTSCCACIVCVPLSGFVTHAGHNY